jgi:hypothetical protein
MTTSRCPLSPTMGQPVNEPWTAATPTAECRLASSGPVDSLVIGVIMWDDDRHTN